MIRKIRISRDEYEQRVLQRLRKELLEDTPLVEREASVKVEEVRLDTSCPSHQVHILFRETSRPECLFGYWAEAVETESPADPIVLKPLKGYWGPEDWANMAIVTGFEDQICAYEMGLPPDCDPDGITWVNGYLNPHPEEDL